MTDVLPSAPPRPITLAPGAATFASAFRAGRIPSFDTEEIGFWIKAVGWLIDNGELEAAETGVRALRRHQPGLEWAANICDLFDRTPPAVPGLEDFQDQASMDIQVVARPGAESALILFCGGAHRMGMALPMIHRWLSRCNASLIYLRDFNGLCYLNGIASLGDGLEATTSALRRTLDALGPGRVVCLGNSGGGFGALRYALELGCDAISLGSPTNLEPDFNAHMNHGAIAKQLKTAFPDQDLDLRRRIDAAQSRPHALIVYGERNWNERIHAEHMAGLSGVELYPVTGYAKHSTVPELIRRGEFEPMLQDFLAGLPPGARRPPCP